MQRKKRKELPTADHQEHLRLAAIVKGVHAELRNKYRNNECDLEQTWRDHCENTAGLSEYTEAMHKLATQHWTNNPETRIDWCQQIIHEYFRQDGLKKVLEKEERKRHFEEETSNEESSFCCPEAAAAREDTVTDKEIEKHHSVTIALDDEKILLLDVGSCFNPFSKYDEFYAVGIDISPALESVYKCDFLNLTTTEPQQPVAGAIPEFLNYLDSPILSLPGQSFHVVVFSLLLEYFPAPSQRLKCCQNAHKLLKFNGILVIITPDSHQQHRNAHIMKSWKMAIEEIGFKRWRYVKLEHLHCMVFRKTEHDLKLDGDGSYDYKDMLKIPQDFQEYPNRVELKSCPTEEDIASQKTLLHELPLVDLSDEDLT